MKKHIAVISVALALVISCIFSFVDFGSECNRIRNDVIRLHILANSDSEADQNIKLIVRDTLLSSGEDIFKGMVNTENAKQMISENKNKIIETVNNKLKEYGFDYKSNAYFTEEYFDTREYEDFTLPAGKYKALKVVLGNGKGKNWWCVMFPPMCLPAASENTDLDAVFSEKGLDIIQNNTNYIIKFKIIELYETLKDILRTN